MCPLLIRSRQSDIVHQVLARGQLRGSRRTVRSITPVSPDTAYRRVIYEETQPKIPAAAITIESAELLQRMHDAAKD